MRFHNLALLISCFALIASSLPASAIHELFADPDVPFLGDLDPSHLNITTFAPGRAPRDKRAVSVQYLLYSITMDGRNQGNFQDFVVSGQMLITDGIPSAGSQNGQNPFDIVIAIGDPNVNPIAGSIRYVTNRSLYKFIGGSNANADLDFAYITTTGSTIDVTVDSRIAAANQLSNFNARTGITMNVYVIASGGFSVTPTSTTLSGSINLLGDGYIAFGTAPYKAIISGSIIGSGTTTL